MKISSSSLTKRRAQRGSILLLSIFFLIVLFLAASSFLVLIPVESRAALRTERQTHGGLVADAGITVGVQFAQAQLSPLDGSASREPMASGVYPSESERTTHLNDEWSFRWELIPDAETFPNGSNPIRAYTVVSRAFRNGVAEREARAEIIQEPLTSYQALYDRWSPNIFLPARTSSASFEGPVHANDTVNLWVPEGERYWNSSGPPRFSAGITSSGAFAGSDDGYGWFQGNYSGGSRGSRANAFNQSRLPYDQDGPISSRYNRLAAEGRDGVESGTARVPLPQNTFSLSQAAWGFNATTQEPKDDSNLSNGVYLNEVDGAVQGIYIEGDVEELELGVGGQQPSLPLDSRGRFPTTNPVDYGTNSWVKIELPIPGQNNIDQDRAVTVLSITDAPVTLPAGAQLNGSVLSTPQSLPVSTTLVRNADGEFQHFNSELNGSIFANGDIQNLWGLNKGRRTIAVAGDTSDINNANEIVIGGREADSNNPRRRFSVREGEKGLIQFGVSDADGDGVLDAPTTADNALGLIAKDVKVSHKLTDLRINGWARSHPEDNPLYLYASVIGGLSGENGDGFFGLERFPNGLDPLDPILGNGFRYQYGSQIVVQATAWSRVRGTDIVAGLGSGQTLHDEAAAASPPPYFPASPNFLVKSYEDIYLGSNGERL